MKSLRTTITVLTVLIALGLVNFLAVRHHTRIDLTEKSVYTLAPATKSLLEGLDDIVTIRVYFSRKLPPQLLNLKRGIDDLLAEYRSAGGGKIKIEYFDPSGNPQDEQRAISLGIMPVQMGVIAQDRQEVTKVYMGVAVLHADKLEALPVVQSTANLEYLLDQAIIKVSMGEEISIGWWGADDSSTEPVAGGFKGMKYLLGERYKVENIDPKKLVELSPSTFKALIIASPGELNEADLFAIDQYVMGGGKLIVLVDLWRIGENLTAAPKKTDITRLLAGYGITVNQDMIMDQSNVMASFAGQLNTYYVAYPLWPQIRPENFSKESPITNELASIVLPWTSSITANKSAEILAKTTDKAAVTSGDEPAIDPETVGEELIGSKKTGVYTAAVQMQGPFESTFKEGGLAKPADVSGSTQGEDGSQIVVVGSARFVQDNFLRRFPENAIFVENIVDSFTIGDKLIGVRSRFGTGRPIAILSDADKFFLRAGNMLIGPILVVIIGVGVMASRKLWRSKVKRMFGET